MGYYLGVDVGTTYTSAAVHRDGVARTVELGTHGPVVPSVVFLKEDGTILTGSPANRRGSQEPDRLAREFKRRLGDTTPILLGGAPHSAEALTGRLLRSVVDHVAELEGSAADRIAIAHPANWGSYKLELLNNAVRIADLEDVVTLSEPAAAVLHYASQERVEPGSVIAVYDLGGGTFDAAVLQKTESGFDLLGEPEGIERLGGVDFDEAIFAHVRAAAGDAMDQLDPDDLSDVQAVARLLAAECVAAKEALSADTDTSIPVVLPTLNTEVRITRAEFEAMIRPALTDSIGALRRALRSAGVEPDGVDAVLLVGGSSRVPLVSQMVGAELGRPVAVDAHPKHAVALGAALYASGEMSAPADDPVPAEAVTAAAAASTEPTEPVDPPPASAPFEPTPPDEGQQSRRWVWLLVAGVVAVAAVIGGIVLLSSGDDGGGDESATTTASTTTVPTSDTSATSTTESTTPTTATIPEAAAACPAVGTQCVEILGLSVIGDSYVIDWSSNFDANIDGDHAHFFWNTFEPRQAGTNAAQFGTEVGSWELTDVSPYTTNDTLLVSLRPPGATEICGLAATVEHAVIDPDVFRCFPIPG